MKLKTLNGKHKQAAVLVAEDKLSDERIAQELGIGRATLHRWKLDPLFQTHVAKHQDAIEAKALAFGIARKGERVAAQHDRWKRLHQVIQARAEELKDEAAGGDTGLIVRQVKVTPSGETVEEYAVDTGLLRELRELEKQAAQEVGQWAEKREITGKDGEPLPVSPGAQVVFMLPEKSAPPDPGEPPAEE